MWRRSFIAVVAASHEAFIDRRLRELEWLRRFAAREEASDD